MFHMVVNESHPKNSVLLILGVGMEWVLWVEKSETIADLV